MRTPAELADLFHQRGMKVTPQRQRVFEVLAKQLEHPTAESVYAHVRAGMPTISLRTVYETLHELAALGEIRHVYLGHGASRFETNLRPHHHMVCAACGRIRNVYAEYPQLRVPASQRRGFRIDQAEVVFRGLCEACKKAAPAEARSGGGIPREGHPAGTQNPEGGDATRKRTTSES